MKTNFTQILALLLMAVLMNKVAAQSDATQQLKKTLANINNENRLKEKLLKEAQAAEINSKLEALKTQLLNGKMKKGTYKKRVERLVQNSLEVLDSINTEQDSSNTKRVCKYYYINDSLMEKKCFDSVFTTKDNKSTYPSFPFFFRIYSDARGFQNTQPNGIFQTEFGFNWKCDKLIEPVWKSKKCTLRVLNNLMLPIVNLFQNKSDSSYRFTPVHYDKTVPLTDTTLFRSRLNVHTLSLIKYASYSVSGKLNLLALTCQNQCLSVYVDLFGTFYATGVSYDSTTYKMLRIKKEDAKFTTYSAGGGLNIKVILNPQASHFHLEASAASFGLSLLNNDVRQAYGKLYGPEYNQLNYKTPTIENKNKWFSNVSILNLEVRYSSLTNKENKAGTGAFFRINFFTNPIFSRLEKGKSSLDYGNNYAQFQLGISKNIDELLDFLGIDKSVK